MHNILTPRGAEVRNALHWSKYIDETIELFGDRTELLFASHHWPTWGREPIKRFLERQRDLYRFIHDETLRLANHGYNMEEIAEQVELPAELAHDFACRGYYGTLRHNVKAVFQFYLGWWDGNPAVYNKLPRTEGGERFIRAMGGVAKVLAEGRRAFDAGDYRWAAEVMNHVMFAKPEHKAGRKLQAEILEQLGYQAESGVWRNMYLTAALELRGGMDQGAQLTTAAIDVLSQAKVDVILDFLGVKFNAVKAGDARFSVSLEFTDSGEIFALEAGNGVLGNCRGRKLARPDVRLCLTKPAFFRLLGRKADMAALAKEGVLTATGDAAVLARLFALLDDFTPDFDLAHRREPRE
jgi:alkyl sulfatase BDS1-like metallo-beta-lactamase superfamily hydrolase